MHLTKREKIQLFIRLLVIGFGLLQATLQLVCQSVPSELTASLGVMCCTGLLITIGWSHWPFSKSKP